MNNNVPIPAQELRESPILPAIDLPLWITGIAFWTLIVLATAMAVFGAEPQRAVVVVGTATVNRIGDVISWDAEKATGRADMLYSDFFSIVPAEKRRPAREMFERAVQGPPYAFHEVWWNDGGAVYSVKFQRADVGLYQATITRSR